MIFYFSATGNCKYVAERIAAARGDKTVSVADCCKSGSFSFEKTGKTVGIISPTYAWGLPVIVREFLQKLTRHMAQRRGRPGNLPSIFSAKEVFRFRQNSA